MGIGPPPPPYATNIPAQVVQGYLAEFRGCFIGIILGLGWIGKRSAVFAA